jgi:hypothetical protein
MWKIVYLPTNEFVVINCKEYNRDAWIDVEFRTKKEATKFIRVGKFFLDNDKPYDSEQFDHYEIIPFTSEIDFTTLGLRILPLSKHLLEPIKVKNV